MTKEEIQLLSDDVLARNLTATLRQRCDVFRKGISHNTVCRALQTENFWEVSPTIRMVLREAKAMIEQDNKRIAAELAAEAANAAPAAA